MCFFRMYEVFRMKTLTVFDPAMCCSTGVCGSDVDQVLVDFFLLICSG
uniref:Arsenical resistance operon trans-acting repressor ArsD n=1 Tax=Klebsiella pneumoniae TaxID=573 RepID=A0A8B0SYE5_KLEPN|nr:Arsenical resistance operon trans-acting repressor ArsD [Klebsiella pneumoniae]